MRKTCFYIILSIVLTTISSCKEKHDARISTALALAENEQADSALKLLQSVSKKNMPAKDEAMYALVYTLAQDKSGLDVKSDSLIGAAYNWYKDKPADSLYSKCQYYMGRYFALNDSSEKAQECFHKSIVASKKKHDYRTQCLALLQLSVILRDYNPNRALSCAKAAVSTYNKVKGATASNKAYYLLNLAEAYLYNDTNLDSCLSIVNCAINHAFHSHDSTTISDSYQDLAAIYMLADYPHLALKASLKSNEYCKKTSFSKQFALSQFYVLVDSLALAKKNLEEANPSSLSDTCAYWALHRDIAIKEMDVDKAEAYADSTDIYLEKKSCENLKARNNYYSLLLQKEITKTKLASENQLKSVLMGFIGIIALIVILLLSYKFHLKRNFMREKMNHEKEIHQIVVEHKEKQIAAMRKFLLSKIDVVNKLQNINTKRANAKLSEEDWKETEIFLNCTDDEFVLRLKKKFPIITDKDLQILMLVRLKLPYESIAYIFNIEEKSVKQRLFLLKKKLNLGKGDISTRTFIENY